MLFEELFEALDNNQQEWEELHNTKSKFLPSHNERMEYLNKTINNMRETVMAPLEPIEPLKPMKEDIHEDIASIQKKNREALDRISAMLESL